MMKKQLFLFILLFHTATFAQGFTPEEIILAGGRSFYTFTFKDKVPTDLLSYKYKNGFAYDARLSFSLDDRSNVRFELGAFQAGSKSIENSNILQWNLNYMSFGTHYLYKIIDKERRMDFAVYAGPQLGISYLVSGQQSVNKLNYDLKDTKAFKSMNFHGGLITGIRYLATVRVNLSLEYRFDMSFAQVEGEDHANGQTTRNIGHQITFGVGLSLQ